MALAAYSTVLWQDDLMGAAKIPILIVSLALIFDLMLPAQWSINCVTHS